MTVLVQVNPVESYVEGVPYGSALERLIMDRTSYFVPGYDEDPRYLSRSWDGRTPLFCRYHTNKYAPPQTGHVLPTGLLRRAYDLVDRASVPRFAVNAIPPLAGGERLQGGITLRDYQVACVDELLAHRPDQRLGGVLQAATGAGKTRIAAKVIEAYPTGRTVFIVNQTDLMEQTIESFAALLGEDIGQVGNGVCDPKRVTVATVQTLAAAFGLVEKKRRGEGAEEDATVPNEARERIQRVVREANVVIVDEAHTVAARTAYGVTRQAINASFVGGLSASPWRDDGQDLLIEAACGPVVHRVSASDLIQLGWLVQPEIIIHKLPCPKPLRPEHYSDEYHKLYKTWIVDDAYRNNLIIDIAYEHIGRDHVVIILVKQIEHGKTLEGAILQSRFLHGKLSKKKRKALLADVRNGTLRCLIATSLADQGLDIPIASALILAGGGKSSTKALQRIGRVLRTEDGERLHPGHAKQQAWVHDLVDDHESFESHFHERLGIYNTEVAFYVRKARA